MFNLVQHQVALAPCPFCKGPPQPIVQDAVKGGAADILDDYDNEGLMVAASVFCHECGAHGPSVDLLIFDRADYMEAEGEAVQLWQQRDARHAELFAASESEGLNMYPRGENRRDGGSDGG